MPSSGPWPYIHAERKALLHDLQSLPADKWDTPSLCDHWTVRQVLGHITATARMTPPRFFGHLLGSGFRFNAMVDKDVAHETEGSPADLLAAFSGLLTATTHPPGPVDAMLGESVVHPADIRRPLGISHTYPTEVLVRVADFYKGSNLIVGAKKRRTGVTLRATDAEWSAGSGPEASGPLLSLIMAMTGRKAALDDLTGEGVATLRCRN